MLTQSEAPPASDAAVPARDDALEAVVTAPEPGAWSRWAPRPESCWTIGVEEEVMLLDPSDWALASQADAVMSRLTGELASHASTETHG